MVLERALRAGSGTAGSYVDVLGVGKDAEEAEQKGLPVLIEADWVRSLRMVGDQLALRMADPYGQVPRR